MKILRNILATSLLVFTGQAVAANGSALIPNYLTDSGSNFYSYFYVSNITSEPVDVTVTFYDASGNIVIDTGNSPTAGPFRASNYATYSESTSGSSVKITINAQGTTTLSLMPFLNKNGYGKIEWTQDNSEVRTAIIAHGRSYRSISGYEGSYAIPINKGIEF